MKIFRQMEHAVLTKPVFLPILLNEHCLRDLTGMSFCCPFNVHIVCDSVKVNARMPCAFSARDFFHQPVSLRFTPASNFNHG